MRAIYIVALNHTGSVCNPGEWYTRWLRFDPKFILMAILTSCTSKSQTNENPDMLHGRHIRGICWPWKKRKLTCTKEGLCSLRNMCMGVILLKYSTWSVSKKSNDLWLHNFRYITITVVVAFNVL